MMPAAPPRLRPCWGIGDPSTAPRPPSPAGAPLRMTMPDGPRTLGDSGVFIWYDGRFARAAGAAEAAGVSNGSELFVAGLAGEFFGLAFEEVDDLAFGAELGLEG